MSTVGIKSYAYCLNHAPETGSFYGGTPYEARHSGKEQEYVEALPKHLQTYEEALHYAPNQTYIGGLSYEEFEAAKAPWIDNRLSGAKRYGKFGEIMPEDEFLALISACDEFELVWLEKGFAAAAAEKLGKDPIITEAIVKRVLRTKNMQELSAIEEEVKDRAALPLYFDHKVVGCVRSGHPTDACLTAHVLMENLAGKASGVLALLHLLKNSGMAPADLDFVIECSEEGAGGAPQAVTSALTFEPLQAAGLTFTDVDRFAPELQNSEITMPAGAGDVPLANIKMIAALAVMKKAIEKADMEAFIKKHGTVGYAHTQGHIPAGVPFIGPACEGIRAGKMKRVMIIGKGSLFLARLTNLADGASFLIEAPTGGASAGAVSKEDVKSLILEALSEIAGKLN